MTFGGRLRPVGGGRGRRCGHDCRCGRCGSVAGGLYIDLDLFVLIGFFLFSIRDGLLLLGRRRREGKLIGFPEAHHAGKAQTPVGLDDHRISDGKINVRRVKIVHSPVVPEPHTCDLHRELYPNPDKPR